MTLSTRAEKALTILREGAEFVHRLETNSYTKREQFQYRLIQNGHVVRGYGLQAFHELKDAGLLYYKDSSTSGCARYRLR